MSVVQLAPEARDFAPDLLTLQESPPSNLPRAALLLVVALLAALIVWAVWARLDIVATAPGRLVPASFTKVVQPAEPGVVSEVLVKDGDTVRAGQILLRLDARLSQADAGSLDHDAELRRLTLLRIGAELAGEQLVLPPGSRPALAAQVLAQYGARRKSYEDAIAQDEAALQKAHAELGAAKQNVLKLREVVPIIQAAADKHNELEKAGFVSQLASADRRREYVEKSQELQVQMESVNALKAAITQQERKLEAVRSSYRSALENERLDTLAQLNRIAGEQGKTSIRAGQLEIRSPADGIVKDLTVTSTGAVVQAGALLMNIVPRNEPLQAEVLLGNEDAGFVAVGQKVQVKVAAYQFQKYGLLEGKVTHVAADATQQQGTQQALTYRALVRLDRQSLKSPEGETLALAPGMLVAAEIHQGDRSVLEYLLSPVQKAAQEAGRER
ncbi:HlyD family type I secretion periplasmic adaptor subunit [Caenimonas sedimenti]|uniref:Membrane fusion protein (MFP) family protein n=1 Tax=Caenimonas sedimenti TaxID=2596921 RepID=A0A562ZGS7_9BURK|nr:HlyD family type I secretion periplasmic adaptor subunit [Caenimonas sedimenti]TWO67782.1 HlyD family type I secretion periplasmic adaptor subunit [Caenimonas sedimenti]